MNIIYLIKIANTNMYKVGFSSNWENRKRSYITDNPAVEFLSCLKSHKKSKHRVERMCQREIEKIGGKFITKCGVKTEWFLFDGDFSFELLKVCKYRKIYGLD